MVSERRNNTTRQQKISKTKEGLCMIAPNCVINFGYLSHTCNNDLVCKAEIKDVPYFNAPIYLPNRKEIGKIDEIFGNPSDYFVSIKLQDNLNASSFPLKQKFFINSLKLLPLSKFLPNRCGSAAIIRKKKRRALANVRNVGSFTTVKRGKQQFGSCRGSRRQNMQGSSTLCTFKSNPRKHFYKPRKRLNF